MANDNEDLAATDATAEPDWGDAMAEQAASETPADDAAADWGDAMAEQAAAETPADDGAADWGDAMAEQAAAEPAAIQESAVEQAPVFTEFSPKNKMKESENDIDFILDIPVQLTVELGRTKIAIKNLLQLAQGSVVELDGLAGEPMDVLVNGTLIAQGEVVVVNEKFGVRLTDIITPAERIRKLNR
jgi:flagellar motor switch protein FliN/FliY